MLSPSVCGFKFLFCSGPNKFVIITIIIIIITIGFAIIFPPRLSFIFYSFCHLQHLRLNSERKGETFLLFLKHKSLGTGLKSMKINITLTVKKTLRMKL